MDGAFTIQAEGAVLSGEISQGLSGLARAPLIFVHGMAGDLHEWDRLLAALPSGLATLRYDLRGFGASEAQEGLPYSHTDDLLVLFDGLGIERAPIVGLSMGGGVALNFALAHPERVSRLILISPAMVGWEWSDEWRSLWRGVADAARDGDLALARTLWLAHPMFAALRRNPAAEAGLKKALEDYHGRQWRRDSQRDELPDIDRLHALAMPTLLLTGELDFPDFRVIGDVIEALAPDLQRIDHAHAGHMLHLERTAEVAEEIARFLQPEVTSDQVE